MNPDQGNSSTTAGMDSNQQPASTPPVDHNLGGMEGQEGEEPTKLSQEVSKSTNDDSTDAQEDGATWGGPWRDPTLVGIQKQFADLSFKGSEAANEIEYRGYNRHNMELLKSLLDRSFQISKDMEKLYADIAAVIAEEENSDSGSAQGNYHLPKPFNCLKYEPITIMLLWKLLPPSRSVGIVFVEAESDGHVHVSPMGTCFRLGKKDVLTCKHVLDGIRGKLAEIPGKVFVEFNFCKRSFESQFEKILFEISSTGTTVPSDDNLDYCVLEMSIPNGQIDKVQEQLPGLGHLVCSVENSGTITLIGHPGGEPKVMDPSCPYPLPDVGVYLKLNPEPKRDFSQLIDPNRVTLSSVMGHGSSGSPGFNKDGNLVLMYAQGYCPHNENMEQGVKMTAIRDDMRKKHPVLSQELFPSK